MGSCRISIINIFLKQLPLHAKRKVAHLLVGILQKIPHATFGCIHGLCTEVSRVGQKPHRTARPQVDALPLCLSVAASMSLRKHSSRRALKKLYRLNRHKPRFLVDLRILTSIDIYVCICTYTHTCIHTYVRTYVRTFIDTYVPKVAPGLTFKNPRSIGREACPDGRHSSRQSLRAL